MKYEDGKPIWMSRRDKGRAKKQEMRLRAQTDSGTDSGVHKAGVSKLFEYADGRIMLYLSKGLPDRAIAHLEINGKEIGCGHYSIKSYDDRTRTLS